MGKKYLIQHDLLRKRNTVHGIASVQMVVQSKGYAVRWHFTVTHNVMVLSALVPTSGRLINYQLAIHPVSD